MNPLRIFARCHVNPASRAMRQSAIDESRNRSGEATETLEPLGLRAIALQCNADRHDAIYVIM